MTTFKKIHVGPLPAPKTRKTSPPPNDPSIPVSALRQEYTTTLATIPTLNAEELQTVIRLVNIRLKELRFTIMGDLKVGTRVAFNAGKRRGIKTGTVAGFARKRVLVQVDGGVRWRVPPTLLKVL